MSSQNQQTSGKPAEDIPMAAPGDEPVLIRLEQTTWERYGRTILFIGLAAALAVVGFALITYSVAKREAAAAAAYAQAKISSDFAKVAQDFSGTPVAGGALIRLAASHRASGEREEEAAVLERFLAEYPKHSMRPLAMIALGKNLRERGQGDLAIAKFEQVFREFPGGELASMAALNAGLTSLHLDKKQMALAYFQQAATTQFNSLPAQQAALEMKLLEAAGVVPKPTPAPLSFGDEKAPGEEQVSPLKTASPETSEPAAPSSDSVATPSAAEPETPKPETP